MKTVFSKVKIFPVATVSKDEISNVVPIGFCQLVDNESIWLEDNFMVKSLENLGKIKICSLFMGAGDRLLPLDKGQSRNGQFRRDVRQNEGRFAVVKPDFL